MPEMPQLLSWPVLLQKQKLVTNLLSCCGFSDEDLCIFGDHLIVGGCMKVLRDGRWSEEEASILVPGDIISIKLGDIVPADSRLLEGDPLKIDQVCLLSSYAFMLG